MILLTLRHTCSYSKTWNKIRKYLSLKLDSRYIFNFSWHKILMICRYKKDIHVCIYIYKYLPINTIWNFWFNYFKSYISLKFFLKNILSLWSWGLEYVLSEDWDSRFSWTKRGHPLPVIRIEPDGAFSLLPRITHSDTNCSLCSNESSSDCQNL